MRNLILATHLMVSGAAVAAAQTEVARPTNPAPASTAPFEQRETWCQKYAEWFVSRAPIEGVAPADARPTQRVENELNYCKLDPQEYERQTLAELSRTSPDS